MNELLLGFSLVLVVAQCVLPLRFAFIPLLIAACHTPHHAALLGQFTAVRLVLMTGLFRAAMSGLLTWNPRQPLDIMIAAWSGFALLSAVGHSTGNPFLYRAGMVFNVLGTYLYIRAYLREPADFHRMVRATVVVLVPLAILLVIEAWTRRNAYFELGARFAEAIIREERNRATGPFGTPILAGTLGAVCFPLFLTLWNRQRKLAWLGGAACIATVVASASSGPIGTLLLGSGAMYLWRWRSTLSQIRLLILAALLVLQLFRERSLWYLISLIDFVGGSTGWHRSRLLDVATSNIGEWWLFGTDYTRHWMPYGLPTDPNNCDLTSYYVHLGVLGGLPLLLTLLAMFWSSFRQLGRTMRSLRLAGSPEEFTLWCAGSALFAHALTFFTISYFDQVYVFFYALVASVPCLAAARYVRPEIVDVPAQAPPARDIARVLTPTRPLAQVFEPRRS